MAGPGELDQFVRKFVAMWQSGQNAKLYVETEAGNAFVHLQVGLAQAKHLHHGVQQDQGVQQKEKPQLNNLQLQKLKMKDTVISGLNSEI